MSETDLLLRGNVRFSLPYLHILLTWIHNESVPHRFIYDQISGFSYFQAQIYIIKCHRKLRVNPPTSSYTRFFIIIQAAVTALRSWITCALAKYPANLRLCQGMHVLPLLQVPMITPPCWKRSIFVIHSRSDTPTSSRIQ